MFDKILKIIYSASYKYLIVESLKNTFKESTFTKNIQKKKNVQPTLNLPIENHGLEIKCTKVYKEYLTTNPTSPSPSPSV